MHFSCIPLAALLLSAPGLANGFHQPLCVSSTTSPTAGLVAAVSQDVSKTIAEGRALLKAGKTKEALAKFEAAYEASGKSPDAYVWVLRTWIDQGRLQDAMKEVETLQEQGVECVGFDYLLGVGSFQAARDMMDAGGNPAFRFGDAVSYLQIALDADPVTYADAWVTLAHASWYAPELDRALMAINKAVEHDPDSPVVRAIEGEIHFSLYKEEVQRAGADEVVPKEHAQAALAAFSRAAELTPKRIESGAEQAAIWRQIGNVHAWLKDLPKASEAFAEAVSWDPSAVDYNLLWQTVVREGDMKLFNATLSKGLEGYKQRFGEESPGSATILWWLGYGQMTGQEHEAAEASFRESVARNDEFLNSWFYVGLTRYHRQDWKGACEGWLTYFDANPASLVATIRSAEDTWLPMVEYAAGKVAETGYTREGGLAALELAERMNQVLSGVKPASGAYWNNLGLLRRDIGALKWRMRERVPVTARDVNKIYDQAWIAYNKAVTLSPKDPGYLNDAAVILHYYLVRDLDTAREYYERAKTEAEKLVEAKSWEALPEVEQAAEETRMRLALRDANTNLRKLDSGDIGEFAATEPEPAENGQIEANSPKD